MKNTTDKINFWGWFLLLVCFLEIFGQIRAFLPQSTGAWLLVGGCVVIAFGAKSFFSTKSFIYLLLYFIVVFLNLIGGDRYFSNIGKVIQEVATLFFTSSLIYYVYSRDCVKFTKWLLVSTMIVIVYYSISTFLINLEYPGIVRETVALINEENRQSVILYMRGLVNYQLPHALPIIIPALIFNIRSNVYTKFIKFLFFVVLVAALAIVYMSYSATALILSILILVLSLMVKEDSVKNNIIRLMVITVIALPLLINPEFIFGPLLRLFSSEENTIYFDRLFELQDLSATGSASGDLASRQTRYGMTFSLIKENILFGSNKLPGGHMAIIDRLAILGLVGFIPYLLFIICQIKYAAKRINVYSKTYYAIGIFAALFMLTMKGMSSWEIWYFMLTIMPLMIWLTDRISLNKNE